MGSWHDRRATRYKLVHLRIADDIEALVCVFSSPNRSFLHEHKIDHLTKALQRSMPKVPLNPVQLGADSSKTSCAIFSRGWLKAARALVQAQAQDETE